MSTQGAQLLAEGPQDVWLSGDPQVSFFRSMYRHHIPFGIELKKMNFDADGSYRFPRYGDMLGPCYITATDPVTNALVPLTSWYGLFDGVALTIGHQLVDFQDVTFSSQVWPTLEGSSFSQRVAPAAGMYPLHFFFCKEWSRAFPLVALEYHDLVIKLVNPVSTYTFTLYGYIIHLDEHERTWVKNTPHKFVITQTQRTMITRDQKEFMRFSGPIKYLAFPTYDYKRMYVRLTYQTPTVIDSTLTQTYSITYYNPEGYTIAWVVPTLPSGVTQTSQTTTGLTPTLILSVAAGTLITLQNLNIQVRVFTPPLLSFTSCTQTSITFGITAPASADQTSYTLAGTGFTSVTGISSAATTTTLSFTNYPTNTIALTAGTSYGPFTLTAVRTFGNISSTYPVVVTAPTAPTLAYLSKTYNSITFTITPPSSGSQVSYSLSGTGFGTVTGISASAVSYTLTSLNGNTSYGPFTLAAVGPNGSTSSGSVSAQTTPPNPPTLGFTSKTATSITFGITAPSGAGQTSYTLAGTGFTTVTGISSAATTYTLSYTNFPTNTIALVTKTTYGPFTLTAVSGNGNTNASVLAAVTTS